MTERSDTSYVPALPAHVVGICAAPGEIEAIGRFFDRLPRDTGMAFVIIGPLFPEDATSTGSGSDGSIDDDLLARHLQIPVHFVEDGTCLEANHVYRVPPTKEMVISGGRLAPPPRQGVLEGGSGADTFFRSLARDCGSRAIAVILSAEDDDVPRGVHAVNDAGGLVLVRRDCPSSERSAAIASEPVRGGWAPATEPTPEDGSGSKHIQLGFASSRHTPFRPALRAQSARGCSARCSDEASSDGRCKTNLDMFSGIANAAGEPEVMQWVARPEEMHEIILEHARVATSSHPSDRVTERSGIAAVYQLLDAEFGIDFTEYKPSTITRRIERRLKLAGAEDIDAYVDFLRSDDAELEALHRDLLIGVTCFFRNQEAFTLLEEKVLPELVRRKRQTGAELRVWVAGCATGEEAYSLAILLHELTTSRDGPPLKVFATDVHQASLDIAARGIYEHDVAVAVGSERLERYFSRRGNAYQVIADLRQMIVFTPHDVLRDIPFSHVDLISCRNLLIYLQPAAQQKILSRLHFALDPNGVIFLGPSESPGHLSAHLETVDRRWRIYQKHGSGDIPALLRSTHQRIVDLLASVEDRTSVEPSWGAEPIPTGPAERLENELSRTRAKLQATVEELETSNEELRATNEELRSSNQELQSVNEELQSLNEELYTLGAEHRNVLADLAQLKIDMDNLLRSIDSGAIFLDRQLRIRRFTQHIATSASA